MLAISAQIDKKVENDIAKCGFRQVFMVPLKVPTIENIILPMLIERANQIQQKVGVIHRIDCVREFAKSHYSSANKLNIQPISSSHIRKNRRSNRIINVDEGKIR